MTNDTSTLKLFTWHFWALAILLVLVVVGFGVVTSIQHDTIQTKTATISQQKRALTADKKKIADQKDLIGTVEGQRDDAQAETQSCADARDAWHQVTVDTYDYLSDIFDDPSVGDADTAKITQEISDAKAADAQCSVSANS